MPAPDVTAVKGLVRQRYGSKVSSPRPPCPSPGRDKEENGPPGRVAAASGPFHQGVAESAEGTDKRTAAVVRQAAGQLRLLASQVREARRQAETHVDWYAELKRDLRCAERERARRDLAKAEAGVARLNELLARQPEPPEDPARRARPSS